MAIVPGVQHVQPDAGGISVGLQQGHGGRVIVGGAVKQIHIGRLLASLGNFLQAGNEGRDADAASHPDLAGRRVVEGEAAVWAFDRDRHAGLKAFVQGGRMVSQRLGDELHHGVFRIPRRGQGVGVGALVRKGRDKGKLPGAVPLPAGSEPDVGAGHLQLGNVGDLRDGATHLAAFAHALEQHQQRRHRAGKQHEGQNPANGLAPIRHFGQDDRVINQCQIG